MTCGIYAIVCDQTWRSYVGQSVNIERRCQSHFQNLKRNVNTNKEFQHDFNKYGIECFHIEILEIVDNKNELITREEYWKNYSYNLYNGQHTSFRKIPKLNDGQVSRFLKLISKTDGCWNWIGMTNPATKYGIFKINNIPYPAHRVSFFLHNQDDNHNVIIRHMCNNRTCCNPAHLKSGTHQDNALDTYTTGTRGILTLDEVRILREKYLQNPNIRGKDLENWYFENIRPLRFDREYLIDVCRNIKWVDENYIPPNRQMRKLNFQLAEQIRAWSESGLSYGKIIKKLSSEFNTTANQSTISNIITGKLYNREKHLKNGDI